MSRLGWVIYGHEILGSDHFGFQNRLIQVIDLSKLIQIKLSLGHLYNKIILHLSFLIKLKFKRKKIIYILLSSSFGLFQV